MKWNGEERRKPETNGRRSLDTYCPVHDIMLNDIDKNSKEINWMKKLMIGTLITGLFTLVGVISSLLLLLIKARFHP